MSGIDRDITPDPRLSLIDRHLHNIWKFLELWVDPVLFPPKILMLVGDQDGSCRVFNPALDYQLVVTHSNYDAAQEWLLEDDYERVKGQILADEVL